MRSEPVDGDGATIMMARSHLARIDLEVRANESARSNRRYTAVTPRLTRWGVISILSMIVGCTGGSAVSSDAGNNTSRDVGMDSDSGTRRDSGPQRDDAVGPADTGADTGGTRIDSGVAAVDGGVGYNPCPSSGICYVMPLGDSITDGFGSSTGSGYRPPLHALAAVDHVAFDTVGTEFHDGHHEGHNGWTIFLIRDSIDRFISTCLDSTETHQVPNIVLLMIGTNDINNGDAVSDAPHRLDDLVSRIVLDAPDALVVVAQIVPNNGNHDTDIGALADFNAAIPTIVAEHVSAGHHVVMVDMHSALQPSDFFDGLHPNDVGYGKMAAVWYPTIGPLLPPAE